MLEIIIPGKEYYDETSMEFKSTQDKCLRLEHSLVSISKWESKWNKPFLSNSDMSVDELLDYIRCMTITSNIDDEVYSRITENNMREINTYIDSPMTATTFNNSNSSPSREIITSEIIYYWMITFNIPFECEKWHLNRLLTLIKVCNVKNNPPKKMSRQELLNRNKMLNAERRKRLNTSG